MTLVRTERWGTNFVNNKLSRAGTSDPVLTPRRKKKVIEVEALLEGQGRKQVTVALLSLGNLEVKPCVAVQGEGQVC